MDLNRRLERLERQSRIAWTVAGALALVMVLGFARQDDTPRSYVLADGKGHVCRLTPEGLWIGENQKSPDGRWQIVWTNRVSADGVEMTFGRAEDGNSFMLAPNEPPQVIRLSQTEGLRIGRRDFTRNVDCEAGMSLFQDANGVVTPHLYAKVQDPNVTQSQLCLITPTGTEIKPKK